VKLLATLAILCASASAALACPLDEGATTLHPGGMAFMTGEDVLLPSRPSLYYVTPEDSDDVKIEAESDGKPVPFTLVDISPEHAGKTMRIDFAIESGPLVVRSTGYRTITYSYRVRPGYTPSHAGTIKLSPYQYGWFEWAEIESDAAIYRIEYESVYPPVMDQRGIYGEIYPHAARFRVIGLYSDRTTAVIYDPDAALAGITRDAAAYATAWLPTFERQPVPQEPTWPRWLALGMLFVASFVSCWYIALARDDGATSRRSAW
jgi:hypothetical protein